MASQSVNQSVISQLPNPSFHQSVSLLVSQSVSKPVSQCVSQPVCQSTSQSACQSASKSSVNQSVSILVSQAVNKSVSWCCSLHKPQCRLHVWSNPQTVLHLFIFHVKIMRTLNKDLTTVPTKFEFFYGYQISDFAKFGMRF